MERAGPTIALILSATIFAVSVAEAQAPIPQGVAKPQPPLKNLQVFPKDIARPELIANMRAFTQALGVKCGFCHVGTEGQPSTTDFASDAKPEKQIARKMLVMVHRINQQDLGISDPAKMKVTCFTCHRGSPKPLTAPPVAVPQTTQPSSSQVPAKPAE